MEVELNAIVALLEELARRHTELVAELSKIERRLNEMQMEVNADVSQGD